MYSALDEAWPSFETFTSNTPKLDCKFIQEHLQECEHCRNMCMSTVNTSVVNPIEHLTDEAKPAPKQTGTGMMAAISRPEFKDVMLAYILGILVLSIIVRE